MAIFVHFFSAYVTWAAIPCLAITSVIFSIKQNTKESMILSSGLILVTVGSLFQFFFPFASEPPLSWCIGSIISSIGLIVTVVGFALVTWRTKKDT